MADRTIVVSFYGDTMENILGNAYESHSMIWSGYIEEASQNFCWSMILMSLEEGMEEIGDGMDPEYTSNAEEYGLRINTFDDFFKKETDYGYDLLLAYNFYDAFEKDYMWCYHYYNPLTENAASWKPELASREEADRLYSKDPKWLRTAKWNLWKKFHERHTELWYQEYLHHSDYETEHDPLEGMDWKETYET